MLKLTNSFYRYFTIACERLDYRAHVRIYAHLSCRLERCVDLDKKQLHTSLSLRKQGKKARLRINIPPLNSHELEQTMSESVQPTSAHVSYGGTFSVSSDQPEPGAQWDLEDGSFSNREDATSHIPPDFRVWEPVGKQTSGNGSDTFKFKVVSYNVLAQYLLECHPYLYTECAPRNLKWKVRADRLYNEIVRLEPDVLCLQEVQVSHLESFYSKFEEMGYSMVFKQKTGARHDGCAIYFKQALFQLQDHISVEFYQPGLPLLNRDNIGVLVKLVARGAGGPTLVIGTTHLLYNPKRSDVRMAQMQLFLAEVDRFAYYNNGTESGHLPIILTGDFNSPPESSVITLLDRGHVCAADVCERDSPAWQRLGLTDNCQHLAVMLDRQRGKDTHFADVQIFNSEQSEAGGPAPPPPPGRFSAHFKSGQLAHGLRLTSVYHKFKADGQEEATTFQDYWFTVDYIYFSCCSGLRVTSRLRLPTASECVVLRRLPNERYASDHLALAATFELTACTSPA